jgi:hypothetical protein
VEQTSYSFSDLFEFFDDNKGRKVKGKKKASGDDKGNKGGKTAGKKKKVTDDESEGGSKRRSLDGEGSKKLRKRK